MLPRRQRQFSSTGTYISFFTLWLTYAHLSGASTTLSVFLFLDEYCDYPSTLNPNTTVPLNTCIVTPGAWSFTVPSIPCDNGATVRVLQWMTSACNSPDDSVRESTNQCTSNYPSAVAGFVVYCGAEEQLQITSTTTVAVATNILSAPTTAPTDGGGSTTINYPATSTPTNTNNDSGTSTNTDESSSSPHGWAAMSNGEKIGAIIALAVGIPSVVIAAIMCMRQRRD